MRFSILIKEHATYFTSSISRDNYWSCILTFYINRGFRITNSHCLLIQRTCNAIRRDDWQFHLYITWGVNTISLSGNACREEIKTLSSALPVCARVAASRLFSLCWRQFRALFIFHNYLINNHYFPTMA